MQLRGLGEKDDANRLGSHSMLSCRDFRRLWDSSFLLVRVPVEMILENMRKEC